MNPVQSKYLIDPSHRSARGSEFSQLALWMSASLAGMVTAVLLARRPFFEKLMARVGRGKPGAKKPSRQRSLPMLAGAIVGSNKATIESVLGPPRSAAVEGVAVVCNPQLVFWRADTWYYPLPQEGLMALAINFHDDLATHVEFFTAPQI